MLYGASISKSPVYFDQIVIDKYSSKIMSLEAAIDEALRDFNSVMVTGMVSFSLSLTNTFQNTELIL